MVLTKQAEYATILSNTLPNSLIIYQITKKLLK